MIRRAQKARAEGSDQTEKSDRRNRYAISEETLCRIALAGGQGSRLMVLTENTAKPAVPFGGKYRIIDFPLSNCVNSGIDTVGILTQYQPLLLNEYIGNGQPWGLNCPMAACRSCRRMPRAKTRVV